MGSAQQEVRLLPLLDGLGVQDADAVRAGHGEGLMGYVSQTVWTCDKCGCTTSMEYRGQPEGWSKVLVVQPPLMSPAAGVPNARVYLCPVCTTKVRGVAGL